MSFFVDDNIWWAQDREGIGRWNKVGGFAINFSRKYGSIIVPNYFRRVLACSRWSELTEALQFHAGISHAARATTEFRLLNGSAPIIVGVDSNGDDERAITQLHRLLEGSPSGGTPLCRHIREVVEKIRVIEPILRANQQRACVVRWEYI